MPARPVRVAITLGDPCGVGPEVALAAVRADASGRPARRLVLVGDPGAAEDAARRVNSRLRLLPVEAQDAASALGGTLPAGAVPVVVPSRVPALAASRRRPGKPNVAAARSAHDALRTAVDLAREGVVDAICTAPVSKEWFSRAGVADTGHTEILAELTRSRGVRLMMALDGLRVVLATTHLALRDVPGALRTAGIVDTIRTTADHLARWWAIARPRVAVAALNPHAGDGGVYGDEEIRLIAPAVARARRLGIDAIGPVPADALFSAMGPRCDAVVAMYHDQGLIPVKQADVHRAVNVTLGLPFVRTSPDHGTAFDIAGRRPADPRSMRSALALAIELAGRQRRAPRPTRARRDGGGTRR
ncbi:4-hydroxythreonine-4-phosphate dehydrogenase PdxA [bacterium]|nr:4-hydroxythreonine-4-phosphate dehydrogenase PdxA [bacterium]